MKPCSKCKRKLAVDEFNKKGKGLQPWCKDCNKRRAKAYYETNREKHKKVTAEHNRKYRSRNQAWIYNYLYSKACADCGEKDPIVLEFDHLRDKITNVSTLLHQGTSLSKLEAEVKKCDVVCANCHRKRTAQRGGSYRIMWAAWDSNPQPTE